jgi:hypothetical protein
MCDEVFHDLRTKERDRKWTLYTLSRFWIAVVLEAPPSLAQLLEQTRGPHKEAHALLPTVDASNAAFHAKCKNFSSRFFSGLYHRFIEEVLPKAPLAFACLGSAESGMLTHC